MLPALTDSDVKDLKLPRALQQQQKQHAKKKHQRQSMIEMHPNFNSRRQKQLDMAKNVKNTRKKCSGQFVSAEHQKHLTVLQLWHNTRSSQPCQMKAQSAGYLQQHFPVSTTPLSKAPNLTSEAPYLEQLTGVGRVLQIQKKYKVCP